MTFTIWFVIIGAILILMALTASFLRRLPLTTSILYLAIGFALGQHGLGLIDLDPVAQSGLLERVAEIAVIIALFTAGLKLRVPLNNALWHGPVRLAFLSMTLTVGCITVAGYYGLGLPLGAAVLLGAALAPTDPVLASSVEVESASDKDRVRFTLTGEAGLNDGTAFPFIVLGVGLLGLHELGSAGWRWLTIDVIWAISGGLAIGAVLGTLIGYVVVYLRRRYHGAVGFDDFLTLGLIALSYGLALLALTYGFLAVFTAGVALRRIERQYAGRKFTEEIDEIGTDQQEEEVATDPETAPAYLTHELLGANRHLEHIGQATVVIIIGAILTLHDLPMEALWFVPLVLFVIRPISVLVGLIRSHTSNIQRYLIAWFGVRGIGSIYYLMHGIEFGIADDLAHQLINLMLSVVVASIILHGITVHPLMRRYEQAEHPLHPGTPRTRRSSATTLRPSSIHE